MLIRAWLFATLLLSALLMGTSFAHALQMPVKLSYDAPQWLRLQHTLYRYYGSVGAAAEIGALVGALGLTWLVRGEQPGMALAAIGAACLAVAFFAVWIFATNAVNEQTAQWTQESIPADWARWRSRWEWSHALRFVLHLAAFAALLGALLSA